MKNKFLIIMTGVSFLISFLLYCPNKITVNENDNTADNSNSSTAVTAKYADNIGFDLPDSLASSGTSSYVRDLSRSPSTNYTEAAAEIFEMARTYIGFADHGTEFVREIVNAVKSNWPATWPDRGASRQAPRAIISWAPAPSRAAARPSSAVAGWSRT